MTAGDHDAPDDALDAAARQLADRSRRRALEIAPGVLRHVLSQPRRSLPIRVADPEAHLHVSATVLRTLVVDRVRASSPDLAVERVVVSTSLDGRVEQIVVGLVGRYGRDLVEDATRARVTVTALLEELLGLAATSVEVSHLWLHLGDVTIGDPQLVDPADE